MTTSGVAAITARPSASRSNTSTTPGGDEKADERRSDHAGGAGNEHAHDHPRGPRLRPGEEGLDRGLRLLLDGAQVVGALEALGVELVDRLGPRRARGEPALRGPHLD